MSRDVLQRLFKSVAVGPGGCWLWTGRLNIDGYGRAKIGSRANGAHRIIYTLMVGDPGALEIDHLCRVRHCVNPAHMEAVTHAENIRRSEPATKTHCVNGHEFTPENTYPRPPKPRSGKRDCRACNRAAVRRYKERKASAA